MECKAYTGHYRRGREKDRKEWGRRTVKSQWPPNQTCLLGSSLGVGIGAVLRLQGDLLCVDGARPGTVSWGLWELERMLGYLAFLLWLFRLKVL